jgi:hypothetical protein
MIIDYLKELFISNNRTGCKIHYSWCLQSVIIVLREKWF